VDLSKNHAFTNCRSKREQHEPARFPCPTAPVDYRPRNRSARVAAAFGESLQRPPELQGKIVPDEHVHEPREPSSNIRDRAWVVIPARCRHGRPSSTRWRHRRAGGVPRPDRFTRNHRRFFPILGRRPEDYLQAESVAEVAKVPAPDVRVVPMHCSGLKPSWLEARAPRCPGTFINPDVPTGSKPDFQRPENLSLPSILRKGAAATKQIQGRRKRRRADGFACFAFTRQMTWKRVTTQVETDGFPSAPLADPAPRSPCPVIPFISRLAPLKPGASHRPRSPSAQPARLMDVVMWNRTEPDSAGAVRRRRPTRPAAAPATERRISRGPRFPAGLFSASRTARRCLPPNRPGRRSAGSARPPRPPRRRMPVQPAVSSTVEIPELRHNYTQKTPISEGLLGLLFHQPTRWPGRH